LLLDAAVGGLTNVIHAQAQNRNGDTPLLQAVAAGKLESVSWLMAVVEPGDGKSIRGGRDSAKRLESNLLAANRNGMTPLMVAACHGNVPVLSRLLQDDRCHSSLASQDKDGYTALHHAARSDATTAPDCVQLLASSGIAIMVKDRKGMMPYDLARQASSEAIASVLLARMTALEAEALRAAQQLEEELAGEQEQAAASKRSGDCLCGRHRSRSSWLELVSGWLW